MPNHFSIKIQSHALVPCETYRCSWAEEGTSLGHVKRFDHKQKLKYNSKSHSKMIATDHNKVDKCCNMWFPSDHEDPLWTHSSLLTWRKTRSSLKNCSERSVRELSASSRPEHKHKSTAQLLRSSTVFLWDLVDYYMPCSWSDPCWSPTPGEC